MLLSSELSQFGLAEFYNGSKWVLHTPVLYYFSEFSQMEKKKQCLCCVGVITKCTFIER